MMCSAKTSIATIVRFVQCTVNAMAGLQSEWCIGRDLVRIERAVETLEGEIYRIETDQKSLVPDRLDDFFAMRLSLSCKMLRRPLLISPLQTGPAHTTVLNHPVQR